MKKPKIPFGLLNGRMVSPFDVPRGLACGCVCAECGGRLIAKHPSSNIVKHFSHYNSDSCAKGFETALHKAAKQVLLDKKKIFLPGISAVASLRDRDSGVSLNISKSIPGKLVTLDSVIDEVRAYKGVIPDIVASIGDKLLFIEIAVTHYVDDEKLEKLKKLGQATLEISLSNSPEIETIKDIEKLVIDTENNRDWLINPRKNQLEEIVQTEAKIKLQEEITLVKTQRKKREEELRKYKKLTDKEKFELELKRLDMNLEKISPMIGCKVKCSFSILASPKTWQIAIYRRFVHQKGVWSSFNASEVYEWLSKRFALKESEDFKDAPKIAIHFYLQHLVNLRLINKGYGRGVYEVWNQPQTPY